MRARNIKPGFYKNEQLADCSVWARYIFPGLWMMADREGRLEDRPKRIKAELLPFDSIDVESLLEELAQNNLIVRYKIDGEPYLLIPKFKEHQNPHYSEKKSLIKPPNSWKPPGALQETDGHKESSNPGTNQDSPGAFQDSPPLEEGCKPADSLIPESLKPIKALSGPSPDVAKSDLQEISKKPDKPRSNGHDYVKNAENVLAYLNQATGRRFEFRTKNGRLSPNSDKIIARLKEGASVFRCREMIFYKVKEWGNDEKMRMYLRPETLFNRTKFSQYIGQLPPEIPEEGSPNETQ